VSGLVCVVPLRADARSVADELTALAKTHESLRGEECTPVPDVGSQGALGAAAAVAGGEAVVDDRGWTVVHGVRHGGQAHPVTVADLAAADGQYAVLSHDAGTGRTLLATDRFAAAPLHVAERDGLLYASTSAVVLAAHLRPEVDADALGAFLTSGYQFGPRTHWHGVRRLEPGTCLEVYDGRAVETEYWRPAADPAVEAMSLTAAADHVIEVATETYRQRLASDPTWIDLTGGYDSRMMALLLDRAGVPFRGNTRSSSFNPDVELARDIAALKGWPWEPMLIPDEWPTLLPGELDRSLAAGDARLEVLQLSRVQAMHRRLAATHPRLLSAGGGEHLQYYAWSTELLSPRRGGSTRPPDLGRWVDMVGLKPAGPDVLAPGVHDTTRRDFVAALEQRAAGYRGEPSSRQLDACYAYKSMAHFGAYRAADDLDIAAQLPFFFEPVFSAAFSVARRHRAGFRLMRTMMERLDPAVAAIETTRGGPALPMRPSTLHRYLPYYRLLGRKGLNKATGQLLGRPLMPFPHDYTWPEQESNRAATEHLRERGVLDWDALRVRPLLTDDGVDLLRRHEASSAMLGRVLTAEMALAATETGL
jgi:hypothetical protein